MENLVLAFLFGCGVFLMIAAFGFRKTIFKRVIDRADHEGPEVVTFAEERILRALLADWSRRIHPEPASLDRKMEESIIFFGESAATTEHKTERAFYEHLKAMAAGIQENRRFLDAMDDVLATRRAGRADVEAAAAQSSSSE